MSFAEVFVIVLYAVTSLVILLTGFSVFLIGTVKFFDKRGELRKLQDEAT